MKRDMDLVRELLVLIEENKNDRGLTIPEHIERNIAVYHLNIMEQAGYVKNNIHYGGDEALWIDSKLTWDGHEFLDSIKNEYIWRNLKDVVQENGGSVSYEVLKEIAIQFSKKMIFGE